MLTLDNVLSPLLKQVGVSVFKHHSRIPPSVNHAICNYSNIHCADHVMSFCEKSDISPRVLFESVGYPASLLIKKYQDEVFELAMLRGTLMIVDDMYIHNDMKWIIDKFQIIQQPICTKRVFIDSIEVVDCLEYFSIIDKRPIDRIDGLSLTKDIGFMTALSIRQYIETGERYYLLPALPNIIENEDLKLSTVLRFVNEHAFSRLPVHLANLILSVETNDESSSNINIKETLQELVGRTWPIDYHRFNLLLDVIPICPSIKSTKKMASNLVMNPEVKKVDPASRISL